MASEVELEKTYLARYIPAQIDGAKSKIIRDVYIPEAADHAVLRLRQIGRAYEITKKMPIDRNDSARQLEQTIPLVEDEYNALAGVSNKVLVKERFYCTVFGHTAEVDVYMEDLAGLVMIDFEFQTEEEMAAFEPPEFCLADVSQDVVSAAGKLAGKTYADIQARLEYYTYKPLFKDQEQA